MKNYKNRIADIILSDSLEASGAVLIEGPKWCGKTTTAKQIAKSYISVDDPMNRTKNLKLAELNPSELLNGETPRLIDEWQIAPVLWDAARHEVDKRSEQGQFIFTGSAVPVDTDEIIHSGTGRFSWIAMRTMSLYESGDSSGVISLKDLFNQPKEIWSNSSATIEKISFLVSRGGWPESIDMKEKPALMQAYKYYDAVVRSDINRADGVNKNPERVKRIMASYARCQGGQTSSMTIKKDVANNDSSQINEYTILSYIDALKKIFVIEDMPAWNPNLRSATAIRTSDTRYFADPSIAVAALGLGPNDLCADPETLGLLFETMCVRDLRVYAQALNGSVYHYRDSSGLECDGVVHLRNGDYGLVEIKLGGEKAIEAGATTLKKLAKKIDTTKMKQPSFMMVLVGLGSFAHKREDGVYVVPIDCLKD